MFNKILIPLDESPLSEQALPVAIEMAKQFKSELILLQAVPPVTMTITDLGGSGMENPTMTTLAIENARALEANNVKAATVYIERKVQEARSAGIKVSPSVFNDTPAKAILDVCKNEGVDLIIITTHGRSGLGRAIVGSVADHVIRHAGIPVMVIRPKHS